MINNGDLVKDLITGLRGVVIGRSIWLYGCSRFCLQPIGLKADGTPQKSEWFDEQRIEVETARHVPAKECSECGIKLGSKVRDTLTGFDGVATAVLYELDGEVHINIEPERLHEGKPVPGQFFISTRVELIEEKAPPVSKQNTSRTGGPQNDPVL